MTATLQGLIEAAKDLSPPEQVELIDAITEFLRHGDGHVAPLGDFWNPPTLEQLVQIQQIVPVTDLDALAADFWPDEESADDLIAFIAQERNEARLRR